MENLAMFTKEWGFTLIVATVVACVVWQIVDDIYDWFTKWNGPIDKLKEWINDKIEENKRKKKEAEEKAKKEAEKAEKKAKKEAEKEKKRLEKEKAKEKAKKKKEREKKKPKKPAEEPALMFYDDNGKLEKEIKGKKNIDKYLQKQEENGGYPKEEYPIHERVNKPKRKRKKKEPAVEKAEREDITSFLKNEKEELSTDKAIPDSIFEPLD